MTSDGPGPPPTGADGAGRGRPFAVQVGEQLRELTQKVGETSGHVAELADYVSRLSPRVDDLEVGVAGLAGAVEAAGGVGGPDDDDEALSLTPALRWSQLDPGARHAAWDALGAFVADVLNRDYRLSRGELPDCWPVHPRAVRELAWLRTLHVDSSAPDTRPDLVAEWHVRWLPAALTNLAAAIDGRECAPGKHRLTEEERRQHHEQLDAAERRGDPPPLLTSDTAPDRPRYLPERFPPRRSYDDDAHLDAARSGPPLLDQATPPPVSSRDCWWDYFLDARRADTAPDPDSADPDQER
ncbi:hypothetical protein Psed_6810 (plasmid) [Pseudonocardia dioxanivorans CB1190]|uniref:DUF4913 domain-containing protein n=1 Tax=Pseudonocardia dioxanivorans (strain ATCC 55486 / DSM 44775 / JCM 13855 / CB1190) TaxID=675635 RepID=F2L6I7_PSEUX|nr:hypothetical protein [Pseudonocardia dioxanivorans]AEA28881.1 hypothetical protein Psed_6810 [Pseudonocardia dioxanivorans CB1190]